MLGLLQYLNSCLDVGSAFKMVWFRIGVCYVPEWVVAYGCKSSDDFFWLVLSTAVWSSLEGDRASFPLMTGLPGVLEMF